MLQVARADAEADTEPDHGQARQADRGCIGGYAGRCSSQQAGRLGSRDRRRVQASVWRAPSAPLFHSPRCSPAPACSLAGRDKVAAEPDNLRDGHLGSTWVGSAALSRSCSA
jgi:hypothetical protein